MPSYTELRTALTAAGEWNGAGIDIIWCGDAYIVHQFDAFTRTWEPRYASKSVRKVYQYVAREVERGTN